jgi:tetratricopeptide (TPR) repeat protein
MAAAMLLIPRRAGVLTRRRVLALEESPIAPTLETRRSLAQDKALLWVIRGNDLYDQKDYKQAAEAYREALRLKPDYADAWYDLATAYVWSGQLQQSIEAYRETTHLNQNDAVAWAGLGFAFGSLGQIQQSIDAFREAVRLKPDYGKAWYNLGTAFLKASRVQESTDAYKQAVRLIPDYAEAWCGLGSAYHFGGQYQQSIDASREAIRLKPDYVDAWNNLAIAYDSLGQHQQASDAYREVTRLKTNHAPSAEASRPPDTNASPKTKERGSLDDLKRWVTDGLVVELQPNDAVDLLDKVLIKKKREVFEFFVVSQRQNELIIGINCSMFDVCGEADKQGSRYHGNFWIKATCEVGCISTRFPPEQVWCNVTLERKHNRTFELYIALPERVGGKAKLSWWKVNSMLATLPTKSS